MQIKAFFFVALAGMAAAEPFLDAFDLDAIDMQFGDSYNFDGALHEKRDLSDMMMGSGKGQCFLLKSLEKMTSIAGNNTKLDAIKSKFNLDQKLVDEIKSKVQEQGPKLKELQGNSTLVQECAKRGASMKLRFQCMALKKLDKMETFMKNNTALDSIQKQFNISSAMMDKMKSKATNMTTKMADMRKNQTLVDECKKKQESKTQGGKSASSSSGGGVIQSSTSAAYRSVTSMGGFQLGCTAIFTALLASLVAGLQV